jgi:hypothetical protein
VYSAGGKKENTLYFASTGKKYGSLTPSKWSKNLLRCIVANNVKYGVPLRHLTDKEFVAAVDRFTKVHRRYAFKLNSFLRLMAQRYSLDKFDKEMFVNTIARGENQLSVKSIADAVDGASKK